jgi:hypothetical protein
MPLMPRHEWGTLVRGWAGFGKCRSLDSLRPPRRTSVARDDHGSKIVVSQVSKSRSFGKLRTGSGGKNQQGLKPTFDLAVLAARLKSRPVTKRDAVICFSEACEAPLLVIHSDERRPTPRPGRSRWIDELSSTREFSEPGSARSVRPCPRGSGSGARGWSGTTHVAAGLGCTG